MQILSNFVEVICYILPKAENLRFKNILFFENPCYGGSNSIFNSSARTLLELLGFFGGTNSASSCLFSFFQHFSEKLSTSAGLEHGAFE